MKIDKILSYFKNLLTQFRSLPGVSKLFAVNPAMPQEPEIEIWPTLDPLKPFHKTIYGKYEPQDRDPKLPDENPQSVQYMVNHLQEQGIPMDVESYNDKFNELTCKENYLAAHKEPVLKKIWEDAKHIHEALLHLRDLGLKYHLDLTGGCVRDFLLGQHERIKDLDFMVRIEMSDKDMLNLPGQINEVFARSELEAVDWGSSFQLAKQKMQLVQLCLNRHEKVAKAFFMRQPASQEPDNDYEKINHNEDSEQKVEKRLIGVIKNTGRHYPHDILITDYCKNDFLHEFDFGLCKASWCLVNPSYEKDFPVHHSHLVSRFAAEPEFFANIVNKKISYNCYKKSKSNIHWSIGTRLPRLQQKYPDYDLVVTGEYKDRKEYAKAYHCKAVIEKGLPLETPASKPRRAKI